MKFTKEQYLSLIEDYRGAFHKEMFEQFKKNVKDLITDTVS